MKTLTAEDFSRIAKKGKVTIKDLMPKGPSDESVAVIAVAKSVMTIAESIKQHRGETDAILKEIVDQSGRKRKAVFTPHRNQNGLISKITMEEI